MAWITALLMLSGCGAFNAARSFAQQHTQCKPIYYRYPRWSPDGTRIAFSMGEDAAFPIYLDIVDSTTLTFTRLGTFLDGISAALEWSPDSTRLIIVKGGIDAYVIDAVTAKETRIFRLTEKNTEYEYYYGPDWSPDGESLVLTGYSSGFEFPPTILVTTLSDTLIEGGLDGGVSPPYIRALPDGQDRFHGYSPRWSPDGSRIAYLEDGNTWDNDEGLAFMNADGSDATTVLSRTYAPRSVTWSPDSQRLVYDSLSTSGVSQIYSVNLDGSLNTLITTGAMPDFSPDGKRIVFVDFNSRGIDELYVMDLEIGVRKQISQNPANGICQ